MLIHLAAEGLPPVLQRGPVVVMCMRKVPARFADRWDCHSGSREELIPAVLTLVISDGTKGEQKLETLDVFMFVMLIVSFFFHRK